MTMKTRSITSTIITLVFILLHVFYMSCKNRSNTQHMFVSHLLDVPEMKEKEFISHFQNTYLPIWRKLNDENILDKLRVFKLEKIDSTTANELQCRFLILGQLVPAANVHDYLQLENVISNHDTNDRLPYRLIRTDVLHCLPNAYLPALDSQGTGEIAFYIEFIAVKDSADFIEAYNNLMNRYFGPLNGVLVEEGKLHSIFMLETTDVVYQKDNRCTWNQIHLSGDFPDYKNINWDSLYTDTFRRTFLCELDSVWALLPPKLQTSFDCEGQQIKELHIN